jgi:hypothetical protein
LCISADIESDLDQSSSRSVELNFGFTCVLLGFVEAVEPVVVWSRWHWKFIHFAEIVDATCIQYPLKECYATFEIAEYVLGAQDFPD